MIVTPSLKGLARAAEIDLNQTINNINIMLQQEPCFPKKPSRIITKDLIIDTYVESLNS